MHPARLFRCAVVGSAAFRMPERFRTLFFALSALLFAVQAASARAKPPSDVISTSRRGGNIVADARMWWSNRTGHSDAFRTQTSNCLDLLDQAEQHRLVAMRHYDQARAKGPLPGSERSRLQRMGNDEYAIVTRLVRQFYECARVQPDRRTARTQAPSDQFGTGSGGRPPPGSDRISTGRTDSGPPRAADAERLCDMQRLALLVSERYARPGLPIATYRLRNVGNLAVRRDRPTYLVVAQGVSDMGFWTYWLEQAARSYSSSSPSPEARLLGALTEQAIGDRYEKAILAAIASLPAGANLVLAGHSLGGMELQRLVSTLRQRGHFVPYVATFGSPIARSCATPMAHAGPSHPTSTRSGRGPSARAYRCKARRPPSRTNCARPVRGIAVSSSRPAHPAVTSSTPDRLPTRAIPGRRG